MMKILVNDYAGHPFQLQLSRSFARMGHEVVHTYFGAYPTPKGRTSTDDNITGSLRVEAISIARGFKQHSALSRLSADRAYGKRVSSLIKTYRPDIVISANTPLDAQKRIQRTTVEVGGRFVFWLQDVLSVAIEFVLRKKHIPLAIAAGYMYSRLERRLLKQSDAIVCIAPDFLQRLSRWKIDEAKTFVIENWAPLDDIQPQERETAWAAEHGLTGKTIFLYSGTLGMKHQPELLLELARKYESRQDVAVVVVAHGAGAEWLRKQASSVREGILQVLPLQPYERLAEVLASGDILITLLDEECGSFAVPSKALAYMCAERALLVAAPKGNLVTRILERSRSGEATAATKEAFLVGADRLLADPVYRNDCAARARAYALNNFAIEAIYAKFMQVFAVSMGQVEEVPVPHYRKVPEPPHRIEA